MVDNQTTAIDRDAILREVLRNLKRVPLAAWPEEQRRQDFRMGAFACCNVLHRMLGLPDVWPDDVDREAAAKNKGSCHD